MKTLTELREFLNNIPHINEGGCLIAAYSIYQYLKQNESLPKDFKIIEIDDVTIMRYMNMMQYLSEDPTSNVTTCGHAVVLYNGMVYDSEREIPLEDCVDVMVSGVWIDPINKEQWLINQMNAASWNYEFDRKKYIPLIAEEFEIDLSMLKLEFTEEEINASEQIVEDNHYRLIKNRSKYSSPKINFEHALAQLLGQTI